MIDPIEQLRLAVYDEGVDPEYHQHIQVKHRKEWPMLWKAIDRLLENPKDLNTLVAEKLRSEHVIGYKQLDPADLVRFECSCGARWAMVPKATAEQIRESMRSHHISAGLKPSEVL